MFRDMFERMHETVLLQQQHLRLLQEYLLNKEE